MKCTIPEISWHNREPVFSVDIHPENAQFYRLASGGGDCHVLIWQMCIAGNGAVNQELVSDLTRHQRSVNCVRWSTTGKFLASGDDDANIIIWQLKTDNIPLLEGDSGDKEIWIVYKVLRGHKEDVYDICWSVDDSKIFSGSVDNTAILWDTSKGKIDHILSDHKGFVQGVAWDPRNQILATISTDRVCRIFDKSGKHVKSRIQKGKISSVPEGHFLKDKEVKFFHDDTFKSFFRRLQFTPDGSLLIVPSGYLETEGCKAPLNATLIFSLDNFSFPVMILPIPKQSSTVVRCCPVLYELREDGPDPIIKLPYRILFAVGTDHDIILYDTQQPLPFARFQDIHYTRLTDLTWSKDGLLLVASSTDGFCSLITFELDELGVPWEETEIDIKESSLNISGCEELEKDENVDINNKEVAKEETVKQEPVKRPSFLEQWALKTPKKRKLEEAAEKSSCNGERMEVITIVDSPDRNQSAVENLGSLVNGGVSKINQEKEESTTVGKELFPSKSEGSNPPKCSTPKRIKPILIDPKPSTSQIEHETILPTKINLTAQSNSSEESDDSESDVELCPEEQQDFAAASQCIKHFFSKKPDQTSLPQSSDAKPIAVKRKPLNSDTEPKPIAVRRKPREENKPKNEEPEAKPIAVRRKPREDNKPKNQEYKITPKKVQQAEPPPLKIKVSAITKSGNKSAQKPKNALLNFLQKSSEKSQNIAALSPDEVVARDSWACEATDKKNTPVMEPATAVIPDDDVTEDFCLQLEESQDSVEQKVARKDENVEDAVSENSISTVDSLKKVSTPKTPRRVSLITLSSPGPKPKKA